MVELIDFINQEKINKKVNGKKILSYFSKCIVKSIVELNTKSVSIKIILSIPLYLCMLLTQ